MPSRNPWSSGQAERYAGCLERYPDHVVTDALIQAASEFDERPSVDDLVRLIEESLRVPLTSPGDCWKEVAHLLAARGLYCDPDPHKPNIFREGEPKFSYAITESVIRQMGGWRSICTSEEGIEALRERFLFILEGLMERRQPGSPAEMFPSEVSAPNKSTVDELILESPDVHTSSGISSEDTRRAGDGGYR